MKNKPKSSLAKTGGAHPLETGGLKTPEQVREEFVRKGIAISRWAKDHGLSAATVFMVLNGGNKGRRGAAHRAAVLLGLKDGVITDEPGTMASQHRTRRSNRKAA